VIANMLKSNPGDRCTFEEVLELPFFEIGGAYVQRTMRIVIPGGTSQNPLGPEVQVGITTGRFRGWEVYKVRAGSEQDRAGLRNGDVIVKKEDITGSASTEITYWRQEMKYRNESYTVIINSLVSFPEEAGLPMLVFRYLAHHEEYLTPDQETKLRATFDIMDEDEDKLVSVEELTKFLTTHMNTPTFSRSTIDVPAIMRAVDFNKDGKLDLRELRVARVGQKLRSNRVRVSRFWNRLLRAVRGPHRNTLTAKELCTLIPGDDALRASAFKQATSFASFSLDSRISLEQFITCFKPTSGEDTFEDMFVDKLWKEGNLVEVFSTSQKRWYPGVIYKAYGMSVTVQYRYQPDGDILQKDIAKYDATSVQSRSVKTPQEVAEAS